MDARQLDVRRQTAQGDAEAVKRDVPRIRLLNTPPHRNLDGERGVELGQDDRSAWRAGPESSPRTGAIAASRSKGGKAALESRGAWRWAIERAR
jgi:hypothetical protein